MRKIKKTAARKATRARSKTVRKPRAKARAKAPRRATKRATRKVVRAARTTKRSSRARKSTRKATSAVQSAVARRHAKSAASMAARVFSQRADRAAAKVRVAATTPAPAQRPLLPLGTVARTKATKARVPRTNQTKLVNRAPNRQVVRLARNTQFNYMRAPGADSGFEVGDTVEVFCDHEQDGERIRGWVKGVVVQVDNKLVAVQFRSNVFLTDGWMVPDRILWYSVSSDQIRGTSTGKRGVKKPIPDY